MPALPNHKHELFAQGLAAGLSADAAHQAAGYKPNRGNAIRMKANESIMRRVAELQAKVESKVLLTLEDHMRELETLRELAKTHGQISAANTAEVKRGELMGYYVERRESVNRNYTISDKPMSKDEWREAYGVDTPGGASTMAH